MLNTSAAGAANNGFWVRLARLLSIRVSTLLLLILSGGILFGFVVGGFFGTDDGGGWDGGACQRHQEMVKKLLQNSSKDKQTPYGTTSVTPQSDGTVLITGDVYTGFAPKLLQLVGAKNVDEYLAALKTVARANFWYNPPASGYSAIIPANPAHWAKCP